MIELSCEIEDSHRDMDVRLIDGASVDVVRLDFQGQSSSDTQGLGCIAGGHKAVALVEVSASSTNTLTKSQSVNDLG